MGATQVSTRQIGPGAVTRDDLDITTTTKAVIARIIAGTNVTISSTGVDTGTGDVTINATGGGGTDIYTTDGTLTSNRTMSAGAGPYTFTLHPKVIMDASVTAATAIAIGTQISPTLIAAANSDVLVGLDINPTFTPGAFSLVTDWGLRVQKGGAWIITTTANDIAFQVSGTNGTLLQVTDTVTGNMLQVNNASAAQIYAVDVTGAHYMASPTFTFSAVTTTQTLVSLPVAGLKSLFIDYYAQNSTTSAWRAGSVIVVTDGTNTEYVEYATNDITAVTSGLVISAAISATNLVVTGTITTGTWNIKLSVRTL